MRFSSAAWLLSLVSCSIASLPTLPKAGEHATILVPGYKGSFLANEQSERIWITPGKAIAGGETSLAVPFPGQRETHSAGPLHADGPITRLSILGIGASVYLPFLEFAGEKLPGVIPFSYDWRQDIRVSAKELCAQIAASPAARVDLVVHSMGGLVALHCLKQGAPKVRRVVFAGTPFRGAAEILKDLARGAKEVLNSSLMSQEAIFTFTAAWQLAPPGSVLLNAAQWEAGLGLFNDPAVRENPAYRSELNAQLEATRAHWKELEGFAPGVPALAVIGTGRDTVSGTRFNADGTPDFDHPPTSDGDGLVPESSARPGFAHEELISSAVHQSLLNDAAVQAAIERFLAAP
jgi:pimeloyl-ACP methyl ester carboxylesterase